MKKARAKPAASGTSSSFDYDVFISYSRKDKAWVRGELLKRIEKAGLRAFIDFRDFIPGLPSVKGMERGVTRCRNTLLVLTPDYVESEWCELENNMSLNRSPANRDGRRIPLLKAPCEVPLHVVHLTHIDFTEGADLDLAWRQLLIALGALPDPVQIASLTREEWFMAHPYAMPPNFTGRVTERAMLTDWLIHDSAHALLVLRALGGFGKSALTWHWLLNDVDPAKWPRVLWWSFYEGDASFESFVANTLQYLNGSRPDTTSAPSASPRDQLVALLRMLHSSGTFLILDGFERALRAFAGLDAAYQGDETAGPSGGGERDCLSPLADAFLRNVANLPGIDGKVLLTTRLRPAALETRVGILLRGCREEELVQLQPADAVAFLHAQGIRGGRAEIEAACEPYGYHPLSLGLLAGMIVRDLEQPGDIAAAQRLNVSGDLIQRQHHVLQQAYDNLGSSRQKLLSRIACFRSAVSYDALKALAEEERRPEMPTRKEPIFIVRVLRALFGEEVSKGHSSSPEDLQRDLRDLIARGLLHHDLGANRFDLHPIVRRYAYNRLAAPDLAGAHARLRDYFAAVPEPDRACTLDDLVPVIELYHHTVRAGNYDEARALFSARLNRATYYQFGAYQLQIDLLRALFPDGEDCLPRLKGYNAQAWTLNALANSYSLSGQPLRAVPLYEASTDVGDTIGVAVALANLADDRLKMGAMRAAGADLRRSVALCREMQNDSLEAVGRRESGRLLAYRGVWTDSEIELSTALGVHEKHYDVQLQGEVWAERARCKLLRLRSATYEIDSESKIADLEFAITPARRALELANETSRARYPFERDYVRAYWLLGAAFRVAGGLGEAENHLQPALERCRRINLVEMEADILTDLARLRMATAASEEAWQLAEEALVIAERCGYVLQGSDAHLVLAQLAKDRGDAKALRKHATEALRLATCDGPPDYTYKAAYDEATALLK